MTSIVKQTDRLRHEAQERIINSFRDCMSAQEHLPEAERIKPTAVMYDIADSEGYTMQGVRKILIENGIYTPIRKRRRAKRVKA